MSCSSETPEPSRFCDDDPLPDDIVNENFSQHSSNVIPKVGIKAIPQSRAVLAAHTVSDFAVLLRLTAPLMSQYPGNLGRPPIDLVMVLDSSESMNCALKLANVKAAVLFVIHSLGACDRLSIVSFASHARRVLHLCRMTSVGWQNATLAVLSLAAEGAADVMEGLKMGVRVLEERRYKNKLASMILFSDGRNISSTTLLQVFPEPIQRLTFPIHTFGFGSGHDASTMFAISRATAGTYSFIESYPTLQEAIASCIGGLMSVVAQELHVSVAAASNGVKIRSIHTIQLDKSTDTGDHFALSIRTLYADEVKEYLIILSIPSFVSQSDGSNGQTPPLLEISCTYKDVVSQKTVIEPCPRLKVHRTRTIDFSLDDFKERMEVHLLKYHYHAASSVMSARQMADAGDVSGAKACLSGCISKVAACLSSEVSDDRWYWLVAEMIEMRKRLGSPLLYKLSGRPYTLALMNLLIFQRATTRGNNVPGLCRDTEIFDAYATCEMNRQVNMVRTVWPQLLSRIAAVFQGATLSNIFC